MDMGLPLGTEDMAAEADRPVLVHTVSSFYTKASSSWAYMMEPEPEPEPEGEHVWSVRSARERAYVYKRASTAIQIEILRTPIHLHV